MFLYKTNEIENKKKEKTQIIDKQPELCTFVYTHMRLVFFERYFIGVYRILCTMWTHAHTIRTQAHCHNL